jgi:hypothetical protein
MEREYQLLQGPKERLHRDEEAGTYLTLRRHRVAPTHSPKLLQPQPQQLEGETGTSMHTHTLSIGCIGGGGGGGCGG